MKTYKVYFLHCSCDACGQCEPRYIGVTTIALEKRLSQHVTDVRSNPHKAAWIKKHGAENICIELLVACESHEDMMQQEVYWIAAHRNAGFRLTNIADGGQGSSNFSEEGMERLRESGRKNGRVGGKMIGLRNVLIMNEKTAPEQRSAAGKKGAHVARHANRGVVKEGCEFCG